MRKRNHPDWPQLVYRVDAYPAGPLPLPESLWTQARAMNTLWNDLVAEREKTRAAIQGLDKAAAKPHWEQFNHAIIEITNGSPLGWEARGEVLDRFQRASRKAFKDGATLRPHYRLDKINIPHRFTGGGMPIDKFFAQREHAKRVRLNPIEPAVWEKTYRPRRRESVSHGIFGLDSGECFSFYVHLDYPWPEGAIVKRANWVGNFNRWREQPWQWSLQLTLEIPPQPRLVRSDTGMAGLDLGWRIMEDSAYIRIGYVVDDQGRKIELRLPMLDTENKWHRRHGSRTWETTIYDVWRLDEAIGNAVEGVKEQIQSQVNPLLPGFTKMRQGGLFRLRKEWETKGLYPELQQLLSECAQRTAQLWRTRTLVQERLLERKLWLYRNLAKWLTTTYPILVWEGNLSPKKLAQSEEGPILANAAKYRQWAAIGLLRSYIAYAAAKNGCELIGPDAAYSTIQDSEGEGIIEGGPVLHLEYPTGRRDQDENAARNLLYYGLSQEKQNFPQNEAQKERQPLIIPEVLRAVALVSSVP